MSLENGSIGLSLVFGFWLMGMEDVLRDLGMVLWTWLIKKRPKIIK